MWLNLVMCLLSVIMVFYSGIVILLVGFFVVVVVVVLVIGWIFLNLVLLNLLIVNVLIYVEFFIFLNFRLLIENICFISLVGNMLNLRDVVFFFWRLKVV